VHAGRVSGRLGAEESYLMDVDNVATARRISTAAFDDTDALMLASKRHDQQLLDDINAKLVRPAHRPRPCPVSERFRKAIASSD